MLQTPAGPPRRRPGRVVLFVALALALLLIRPARAHLRAASLLVRFADANAAGALADFDRHAIGEPALGEQWALVHFMARVLDEAAAVQS